MKEISMRYRLMLWLAAAALELGMASFFIASPTSDGFLYAWFYWLPSIVSYWVNPEADAAFVALSMAVYTVQYLALFGLLAWSTVAVKFAVDFVGLAKHKRVLTHRRA
jgi:hypothetical protein